MTVKLLIDECLHTSLVEVAHAAGHLADHVNYLGLSSSRDWQLMSTIRAQDYTFVTNNRSDFLSLHGQEPLHAGVVIIVPNVTPARQRELFTAKIGEWRSNVCSALTKQTAKSTYGPIGFFNDSARSPRESRSAKRQRRTCLIPLWRFAAFASNATASG